jgi:IMP dehydrogenase
MAIAMAQMGGMGIVHRNFSPEEQAIEVKKVKKYESGVVSEPIVIGPDETVARAESLRETHKISGFPVVNGKKLLGILTSRDLKTAKSSSQKVSEIMTPRAELITAAEGVDKEDALKLIHGNRIEKLPIVDGSDNLIGLITLRDLDRQKTYPHATKDGLGRLRVGAAIGVGEEMLERVDALNRAGVDVVVVDTAHGHSQGVVDTVKMIRSSFADLQLIAGNVATKDGAAALISAGVDAVKVGVGPGSICTTRIISGVGVPQITAIAECVKAAAKKGVPVIADGGIKYSGDVVKAIAAGADVAMMGSAFAGTDQAPGAVEIYQGRAYKVYRGMGSIGAMSGGSKDRYGQAHVTDSEKLVPEGIEGRIPYRGEVQQILYQFVGGLRSGMGYTGSSTIKDLKEKSCFIQITAAGLKESHVHDVIITKEAPNYGIE